VNTARGEPSSNLPPDNQSELLNHKPMCVTCGVVFFSASGRSARCLDCRTCPLSQATAEPNITLSALTPSGETHILSKKLQPSSCRWTVRHIKQALSAESGLVVGRQQLWLTNDQREDVRALQNHETIQTVLAHAQIAGLDLGYDKTGALPPAQAVTELELTVMIGEETEWRVLVALRDATDYALWSANTAGWDTLEEHQDPSCCAGVTVETWSGDGKVTEINLSFSNLQGGECEKV
jgi:hypothetical protein